MSVIKGTCNELWEQKKEEINFSWKMQESFAEEEEIDLCIEE